MASKYKRTTIGSIIKAKEAGEADYLQIRKDLKEPVVLKPGQSLQLESVSAQRKSAQQAAADGKLSEDIVKKIMDRLDKVPDFVRFEVVLVQKS